LHTEVEAMMKQMGKEQKLLIAKQMQAQAIQDRRRQARLKQLRHEFIIGVSIIVIILSMGSLFMYVAYDRQQKYPQYGDGLFPKTEEQRRRESQPTVYIGR